MPEETQEFIKATLAQLSEWVARTRFRDHAEIPNFLHELVDISASYLPPFSTVEFLTIPTQLLPFL